MPISRPKQADVIARRQNDTHDVPSSPAPLSEALSPLRRQPIAVSLPLASHPVPSKSVDAVGAAGADDQCPLRPDSFVGFNWAAFRIAAPEQVGVVLVNFSLDADSWQPKPCRFVIVLFRKDATESDRADSAVSGADYVFVSDNDAAVNFRLEKRGVETLVEFRRLLKSISTENGNDQSPDLHLPPEIEAETKRVTSSSDANLEQVTDAATQAPDKTLDPEKAPSLIKQPVETPEETPLSTGLPEDGPGPAATKRAKRKGCSPRKLQPLEEKRPKNADRNFPVVLRIKVKETRVSTEATKTTRSDSEPIVADASTGAEAPGAAGKSTEVVAIVDDSVKKDAIESRANVDSVVTTTITTTTTTPQLANKILTTSKEASSAIPSQNLKCLATAPVTGNVEIPSPSRAGPPTKKTPKSKPNGDCRFCPKKFSSRSNLTLHVKRVHQREEPKHSCDFCVKKFYDKTKLTVHLRIHTGEKPYACSICDRKFSQKFHLQAHANVHRSSDKENVECLDREAIAETSSSISRANPAPTAFQCLECGKVVRKKTILRAHMRVHTGHSDYTCAECGKGFLQGADLKRHLRVHSGETPFSCCVCGRCFKDRNAFKVHCRIHSGERPYACKEVNCCQTFRQLSKLKHHEVSAHPTLDAPHKCSLCGKKFAFKKEHALHEAAHRKRIVKAAKAKEEEIELDEPQRLRMDIKEAICSLGSTDSTDEVKSTKEAPETPTSRLSTKCLLCGKAFKSKENLHAHERTHQGLDPFPCDHCGRGFRDKSKFKMHVREVHSGRKPYACDTCGHEFKRRMHLTRHQRVHSKITPYTCLQCRKIFKWKESLDQHMKTHASAGIGEKFEDSQNNNPFTIDTNSQGLTAVVNIFTEGKRDREAEDCRNYADGSVQPKMAEGNSGLISMTTAIQLEHQSDNQSDRKPGHQSDRKSGHQSGYNYQDQNFFSDVSFYEDQTQFGLDSFLSETQNIGFTQLLGLEMQLQGTPRDTGISDQTNLIGTNEDKNGDVHGTRHSDCGSLQNTSVDQNRHHQQQKQHQNQPLHPNQRIRQRPRHQQNNKQIRLQQQQQHRQVSSVPPKNRDSNCKVTQNVGAFNVDQPTQNLNLSDPSSGPSNHNINNDDQNLPADNFHHYDYGGQYHYDGCFGQEQQQYGDAFNDQWSHQQQQHQPQPHHNDFANWRNCGVGDQMGGEFSEFEDHAGGLQYPVDESGGHSFGTQSLMQQLILDNSLSLDVCYQEFMAELQQQQERDCGVEGSDATAAGGDQAAPMDNYSAASTAPEVYDALVDRNRIDASGAANGVYPENESFDTCYGGRGNGLETDPNSAQSEQRKYFTVL